MKRSEHNLKISKFRQGCRLPFETAGAGDEYAGAGPVITYYMDLEEIKRRYGPARQADYKRPIALRPGQRGKAGRKKGGTNMASIMETARQTLPAEVLGPLLAEGRTQQSIADEYNVPFWAVSSLKKEYWPDGFKPDDYKSNGQTDTQEQLEEQQAVWEPEVDQLVWAEPFRLRREKTSLKIFKDYVSVSSAAIELIRPAEFVKVGVLNKKSIVLAPAKDGREGYKLTKNKIGGGALVKFLKEHGFELGEYPVVKDGRGWLVSKL